MCGVVQILFALISLWVHSRLRLTPHGGLVGGVSRTEPLLCIYMFRRWRDTKANTLEWRESHRAPLRVNTAIKNESAPACPVFPLAFACLPC